MVRPLVEVLRARPELHLMEVVGPPFGPAALVEAAMSWAIEEAMLGAASEIRVTLHDDGSMVVADDGDEMTSATAETLMATMSAQRRSARLSGTCWSHLGPVVVNALSAWCVIEGGSDARRWRRWYKAGVAVSPFMAGEPGRGTTIRFAPDPAFFAGCTLDGADLRVRLGRLAALAPGVRMRLFDARGRGWR